MLGGKKKGLECLDGLMEENMLGIGLEESSMELEWKLIVKVGEEKENGAKGR